MSAQRIKAQLKRHASHQRAQGAALFFKTGPGEYSEGDLFIGVSVPKIRTVAKEFSDLSLVEIEKLLKSKIHEHRLIALIILTNQSILALKKEDLRTIKTNAKFYLKNKKYVNNWDLVDCSARYVLGPVFFEKPIDPLIKMAKSKDLWTRRIAVLTTFHFIAESDFRATLEISELLLKDGHDLIHKATGWMLREVGKRDETVLCQFLDKFCTHMPRTMLRYAIERLPEKKRLAYLRAS